VLICVKPAVRSRFSISSAALRDAAAVAPGQRGWDTVAMRPPGPSRWRSPASRSAGAGQNPRELTARMASYRGCTKLDTRRGSGQVRGHARRRVPATLAW
jgi:hypothetical protein